MNISAVGNRAKGGLGPHTFYAKAALQSNKSGLKSTQQKVERMQKAGSQIEFWEKQKENLKNMQCDTLDEIARKLELFHNYEDEIAAVKAAYNSEQIWHVMDEAREMGEKIAEAIEKTEPKTPEERQEELREEITGTEEGILAEALDEILEGAEAAAEGNKGDASAASEETAMKSTGDFKETEKEAARKGTEDFFEAKKEKAFDS